MKTMHKIMKFVHKMRDKNGEDPKFLPLTSVELMDAVDDIGPMYTIPVIPKRPIIHGLEVETSLYAPKWRNKMLKVPLSQFITESEIDDVLIYNSQINLRKMVYGTQIQQLKCHILSDKTKIKVTFEWDVFAKIKRLLRITKWFPVKTKSQVIDCKVLYPYCKVNFPHNKHVVHFE